MFISAEDIKVAISEKIYVSLIPEDDIIEDEPIETPEEPPSNENEGPSTDDPNLNDPLNPSDPDDLSNPPQNEPDDEDDEEQDDEEQEEQEEDDNTNDEDDEEQEEDDKLEEDDEEQEEIRPFTIYKDYVTQNIRYPAFFIYADNTHQEKGIDRDYWRTYNMVVSYQEQPDIDDIYEQLEEMGHKLMEIMQIINVPMVTGFVGDGRPIKENVPVRANYLEYFIDDKVLKFLVSYTIKLKTVKPKIPFMQSLNVIYQS